MTCTHGYAALAADTPLQPFEFTRRDPREDDVVIEITHCGICHSDLHILENDFGTTVFPLVPGHEIVGVVREVGTAVTKFRPGDVAAVSTYVNSCGECAMCRSDREHMCEKGMVGCMNCADLDGSWTYGGYSNNYVLKEKFALKVPTSLNRAGAAPLLCGGLTVYPPLRKWSVGPGSVVGVAGLGGLGHLAVKMAVAMGATVVVFSTSDSKTADALRFGASDVIVGRDAEKSAKWMGRIDLILDTISAVHDVDGFIGMLRPNGTLCVLGAPMGQMNIAIIPFVMGEKSITGSMLGGLKISQEMLDFCGRHGIEAEIESIRMDEINDALKRLHRNDVRYRFVIDMATLSA